MDLRAHLKALNADAVSSVLPGIAFSLDLIETTNQYGVSEVLLSSFMAAFIFSVFGAQPLCIAGVTGPITVFNKTIYDIIERQTNPPDYLQFVGWVYLWGAILHWITAAMNCECMRIIRVGALMSRSLQLPALRHPLFL